MKSEYEMQRVRDYGSNHAQFKPTFPCGEYNALEENRTHWGCLWVRFARTFIQIAGFPVPPQHYTKSST